MRARGLALPAFLAAALTASASAQANTGTLLGKVADPHGLAVPNAKLTIRSTDLASTRTAVSDASGRFAVTGLVPGAYTVEAHAASLATRRPIRLTVGLGSSTQLAVRLDLPTVRQSASVTARPQTSEGNTTAPPINQSEPSISNFLAGTVVTYLPNRNRDVTQFNQLAANAHEDGSATGVSIGGQRASAVLTQVDGVDLSSPLFGGLGTREDRTFTLPQTVVREFQIVSSGVSAATGETNAGLINVATKEGSNKFHGEAMYTGRPSALTSADAFGHSLNSLQRVFGTSFGGPIVKNRSFFYTGVEQEFLHAPYVLQFAPQAPGVVVPASLAALQTQTTERSVPLAGFFRVDHVISASQTLNVEIAGNRIRTDNLSDGFSRTLAAASHQSALGGQSIFTRAGLTSVFGPRVVNQAQISYVSDHRAVTPNSLAPESFINGFGVLGGASLGPHRFTSRQLQLGEGISLSRGKALFDFGATFHLDPSAEQREENLNGRFAYNSVADFLANHPRRFQQTFLIGNTQYAASVRQLDLYANGRFDVRENLTLTAGLRWAGQWNPQPAHPNAAIAQTQRIPNDLLQFQPRLGVAWSPASKTVLRVSSGLYSAPTPATYFHRVFADSGTQTVVADSYFDPQLLGLTGANMATPHALSGPPAGLTTNALLVGIAPGFRNPMSLQAAADVDQMLSPKLTLRAGYLHASTWHVQRMLDENLSAPTANGAGIPVFLAPRPIAGVGRLLVNESNAHSSYDAVNVTAISQISRRSQFTVNYTYSHTRDDDSNAGPYSIDAALNPFNLAAERGPSSLDLRHTLNVAAIFNLPYGFKLNPLVVMHSGAPYTAITGFDTQNDANDFNDRAVINGVATGRNAFRQPAFSDTDLRFVKDFTLKGEGHHLDLFMDVFNVFGAGNRSFGADGVSFYGNAASPVASAGQALFAPDVTRIGGPRGVQFTARLVAF